MSPRAKKEDVRVRINGRELTADEMGRKVKLEKTMAFEDVEKMLLDGRDAGDALAAKLRVPKD